MSKNVKLKWSAFLNGDGAQGNMAGDLTSDGVQVSGRPFSIQYVWTDNDNPIGAITLEGSNNGGANWDDIPDSLFTEVFEDPNATTGSHTIWAPDVVAERVRLKYTHSGGGTADVLKAWLQVRD